MLIDFGVEIPRDLLEQPARELARQSQTNQTPDPEIGLQYAAAAYHKGSWPEVAAEDPTVAGEAAIKAALRIVQGGDDVEAAYPWIEAAFDSLQGRDLRSRRELAMARFVGARTFFIARLGPQRKLPAGCDEDTIRSWLTDADEELRRQHVHGHPWDRYGTMLCRVYATFEAIEGCDNDGEVGRSIAAEGMIRAENANREGQPISEHLEFVNRYYRLNRRADRLAMSKPHEADREIQSGRLAEALSIVR
jgi:hypothetical protein